METITFTEHCASQGCIPGAILNSVLDHNAAVVVSIHEATMYAPAFVRTRLSWPAGMDYQITDDWLPDWSVVR